MTPREALTQGLAQMQGENFHPQAVDKLLSFSDLLLERNKVMNLTAVTDPVEVVTRHFLDCAALVPWVTQETETPQIVDVGCGAGFPGMPLAILTDAHVTMLDSLKKRIVFLQECIEALGLNHTQAVHGRAEEFGPRASFDCAVSRAVARLNVLAELCLPLVRVGGRFIAMKADDCDAEIQEAAHAISLLGGELEQAPSYLVPLTDLTRRLVIVRKVRPTPPKYPRRFAKISASPL